MNGDENIEIGTISTYNPSSLTDGNKIGNRRCYVALVNSDRSLFGSTAPSDLSFKYDPVSGKFYISTTLQNQTLLDNILYVAVDNYKPQLTNGNSKVLVINLLGVESSDEVITYTSGG